MPINKNLNIAPYFDDFDVEKQFYKINSEIIFTKKVLLSKVVTLQILTVYSS